MSPKQLVFICLAAAALSASGCSVPITPEVIQDTRSEQTLTARARPSATPTGPTRTPTATSTPYIRPTDAETLDLDQPIARVGDQTITLGQFRARVRYERFAALDEARRIIEIVGLEAIKFTAQGENRAADRIAAIFNTLANSANFGYQVYDIMLREAVIRAEFKARNLSVPQEDVDGYWIRRFNLQLAPDPRAAMRQELPRYLEQAVRYSGMSEQDILAVAESFVMATLLQPIIGRESAAQPSVLSFRVKRLIAATEADAQAAKALIESGEPFRAVACRYSIDPAVRGKGGALGFRSRATLPRGLPDPSAILAAESGSVTAPQQSPLGWHIFKVGEKRRDADGELLADVAMIVVASQTLAEDIAVRVRNGEDFAALACQYSLDSESAGNGGDYGWLDVGALPPEWARFLATNTENGLFGVLQTAAGYELILVEERRFNLPSPQEVERATEAAFRSWQARRLALDLTTLSDAWRTAIPSDPLPRQVAPFLSEEAFGLPTPLPTAVPTP
ncbi:MAG: peptidylprolyl isomerase [Anaerolineae bacterium]|nr:peptidylprolyl isomerase [Anaerolineae bacterium]